MSRRRSNNSLALSLVALVAGMGMLAYASVPLYRLFCQVTGFGGTTQVAEAAPATVSDRQVTVRFNAYLHGGLPWDFKPVEKHVAVNVGQQHLISYTAENLANTPVKGTATFNVTPLKAGQYFSKIQCFCFEEQTLQPGQKVSMPVSFFVDPAIEDDPNLDDVTTITLSYTFFQVKEDGS